jgi:hypothetical protein
MFSKKGWYSSHQDSRGRIGPFPDVDSAKAHAEHMMARSAAVQTMPEGATARREDGRYDWEVEGTRGTEPTAAGAKARIESTASRKQAWSGWGPSQVDRHHRVAGWDWDNYQNGYISQGSRKFACSCGQEHTAPSYGTCKCGKVWNVMAVGIGGDRHEAMVERYIAREIPVRDGVIVANTQRKSLTLVDGDFPEHRGYDLSDEIEDTTPWPSDHHPKSGDSTMKSNPTDWHSRDNRGKWTSGGAPNPNQFKKK